MKRKREVLFNKANSLGRIIKEIDKKMELPDLVKVIFKGKLTSKQLVKLSVRLKYAGRYSCLLDYYHETHNESFLQEAKRQKQNLFLRTGENTKQDLNSIENEIVNFFDYEREISLKIKQNQRFSDQKIKDFVEKRAKDTIYYLRIMQDFVSDQNLPKDSFYYRLALYDTLKDFSDYESDLESGHPNVLTMVLLGGKNRNFSKNNLRRLRTLIDYLRNKAVSGQKIKEYPVLVEDIERKYKKISELINIMVKKGGILKEDRFI